MTVRELLLLADAQGLTAERNALFVAYLKLMEKLNGQQAQGQAQTQTQTQTQTQAAPQACE